MYKKLTFYALAFALVALVACKHGDNDNTDDAPLAPGMVRLDLSKAGIQATIDVPDTVNKQHGIEAQSSGGVNVFVGKGFHIVINVSGEPIAMKKSDANGDDINKPKAWVVDDSTDLLYSTQKDTNAFANAKEEFHFYALVRKGKATYYVEDLRQGTDGTVYVFSKEQAQTMLTAAKTLTPKAPPAKNPS